MRPSSDFETRLARGVWSRGPQVWVRYGRPGLSRAARIWLMALALWACGLALWVLR